MTEKKIRSFIAIELTDEMHARLSSLQDKLKLSNADAKWVNPQNIHLTLKFLGYIDDKLLSKIKDILDEIARPARPFKLTLSGIGAFPKINYPRVIWAGMNEDGDSLKNIVNSIEDRLSSVGFEKEGRPFTAHLTLARIRSAKNKENLIKLLDETSLKPDISLIVGHITLFESTLTIKGSIYTILYKAKFAKSGA